MKAVTGVFGSQPYAQRALVELRALGLSEDRLTLLTPGGIDTHEGTIPTVSAEQPGMGKAMGAVVGAATGLSGGPLLVAALIPGVGPITVIGLLGGAVAAAAGAGVGATVGGKLENAQTEGLPEDEIFVYEDALRKGRSVLIAMANDNVEASLFCELLKAEGAESIDPPGNIGGSVCEVRRKSTIPNTAEFWERRGILPAGLRIRSGRSDPSQRIRSGIARDESKN